MTRNIDKCTQWQTKVLENVQHNTQINIHANKRRYTKTRTKWNVIWYTEPFVLRPVHTCEPNHLCRVHKWFVYQMCVCVDRTANICCAVCILFLYHSSQTKIYWFFTQKQRELCIPHWYFFHVHKPHICCLCFLHFFQYRLVDVSWVCAETMVCHVFTSRFNPVLVYRFSSSLSMDFSLLFVSYFLPSSIFLHLTF